MMNKRALQSRHHCYRRKCRGYLCENYLSTTSGEDNQLNIVSEVIAGANSNVTYGSVDYLDKDLQVISFVVVLQMQMLLSIGH